MKSKLEVRSSSAVLIALALTTFFAPHHAFGAGYEKSIMWGGRSSGFAGIATPYTTGADALYFNPAGIVADKAGQEVSFNVSPVQSQFKGPINNANEEATSSTNLSTPFGLIYGNTVDETWGFAVGGYVSGGSKVTYEDITYTGVAPGMDVKTDLQLAELAVGGAYRVNEKLKLGASVRSVMASGEFGFISRANAGGTIVANAKFTDLKDTKTGFALGAQYKLDDKNQLGLRYRSEINLEPSGRVGGLLHTAGGGGTVTAPIADAPATVKTTFPQALTLGVLHKCDEMWTLLAEYGWTNYSKVDLIGINASINGTASPNLQQYWHDQHNYRLAAQWGGEADWPIRFGYGYTTAVTNEDYARASFFPPAPAHTVTVGTGHDFAMGEKPLRFDSGLEYTFGSAEGNPNGAAAGTGGAGSDLRKGTFSTTSYALHLGLAYMF